MGRREGGLLYPRRTWLLDTGAGADTVPGTITKWEYEFPDGTDISGTLNMDTTVCPYAVFRCNGQLTISGAIDGDGDGSVGGAGGAVGVWDVDHWNTPPQPGSHGAGPGGGAGGATWINDTHVAGNGGGGGHAAEGTANPVGSTGGGEGGHIYSSLGAILQVGYGVWCSGSGGGGGGSWANNATGANGGNGGAGVIIVAHKIRLSGTITVDGANGGDGRTGSGNRAGDGGSGSGGLVVMVADEIDCTGGTITATGGTASPAGGTGRVYMVYTASYVAPSSCDPAAVSLRLRPTMGLG